jgi:hypothetical protein
MLPARLALPPHLVASVRLLRHRFLDEAADVRQAAVGSARAATLSRRWIGFEANDASACAQHFHSAFRGMKKKLIKTRLFRDINLLKPDCSEILKNKLIRIRLRVFCVDHSH